MTVDLPNWIGGMIKQATKSKTDQTSYEAFALYTGCEQCQALQSGTLFALQECELFMEANSQPSSKAKSSRITQPEMQRNRPIF